LAEEARPELRGPRQQEWLQRLDAENDNLRAAMTWVLSAGDYAIAARSGWAVWLYWWLRGQLPEGRRWMEAVIARSDQLPHTLRARALMVTETIAYGQGDIASIEKYADELLELAGRTGDQHAEGFARYGRSLVAMSRREWEDAAAHLTEAAPLLHRSGDFGMASSANTFLGRLLLLRGDVPAGTRRLEQGLAMAREAGDSLGMSIALFNLAQAAQAAGDHAGAASHLRAGVVLSAEMQHRANLAYFLEGLAGVLHAQGRSDRSARLLGAAEGLLETMTGPTYNYYTPDRSGRLPLITELRERVGAEGFAAASEEGQEMTIEQAVEYALADAQGAG
jgi:tetratricopeptide (TPR) repeat protein